MAHNQDLASAPILKLAIRLAIPAMMAQVVNMLYNIVDRIYIGHIEGVGELALTGVGVTYPIVLLVSAFAALAGMGGAPLASIQLGAKNPQKAEQILGNAVTMLLFTSIVLTAFFSIFKEPLLYAFGASDEIIIYALDYISIYLVGTVFVQLALGLNTFISAQGKATVAMASVLIGAIINIVLDPILIFGLNMGVKGAATATVISQCASATWVVSFLLGKNSAIRIRTKNLRPSPKLVTAIAGLGIAPFIMQSTESLVSITLNSGLQTFGGDLYVGAMTILQSLMLMVVTPIQGLSQGIQPIMGYNYGAKNYQRVREAFQVSIKLVCSATTIACLVMVFGAGILARMFTPNTQYIALVAQAAPIYFAGIWAFGAQMSCQSAFMAMGQSKISLFLALLRKVILLVPLAYILPRVTGEVMTIFLAEPIADMVASATTLTIFLHKRKTLLPVQERLPSE